MYTFCYNSRDVGTAIDSSVMAAAAMTESGGTAITGGGGGGYLGIFRRWLVLETVVIGMKVTLT